MKISTNINLILIKMSLLTASALWYWVALYDSTSFWWCIFLFPIPVYLLSSKQKSTFFDGFLWGVLFFNLTLHPFFNAILKTKSNLSIASIVVLSTTPILYCALYSACWFWLMGIGTNIIDRQQIRSTYSSLLYIPLWLASTLAYVISIDHYCLWPLLRLEGIPLLHPLIGLTAHPQLLHTLPCIGKNILTLLLLLPAAASTSLYHYYKSHNSHISKTNNSFFPTTHVLLLLCSLLMPWVIFLVAPPTLNTSSTQKTSWLQYIAWLPIHITGTNTAALLLQNTFTKILKKKPQTQLIILPESALYSDSLCTNSACTQLWQNQNSAHPLFIIAGSFNRIKNNLFNTCYCIHDGVIIEHYSKKHTIPFIEQLPLWAYCHKAITLFFTDLFFTDLPPITPAQSTRKKFTISFKNTKNNNTETVQFVPYICSELFFNENPDDTTPHIPILALINDTWATQTYIQKLMLQAAQFKALQWQREILYIGYNYGCHITKTGTLVELVA